MLPVGGLGVNALRPAGGGALTPEGDGGRISERCRAGNFRREVKRGCL